MTWLAAKLFMGGALKRLWGALQGAFAWAWANPLAALLIASLCLSAWLWRGWNHADATAAKWQAASMAWEDANAEATRWAKAEAARKDQSATQAKDTANAALKPSLAAGQTDTARFVRGNRCLRVTPAKGGQLGTDLSGAVHAPGQPAGASGETFVAVADDDPGKCTAAVLRLDNAVNVWAKDMIARGLAK